MRDLQIRSLIGASRLKLIRVDLAADPAFRGRFQREVEAGQRVGGTYTARYLDADTSSEHPYLVTEYVEGGNLANYVAVHGPLSGDQLVALAIGLAEALVTMSAAGVVHRDLKPSNVLMAATGPRVVDFGISHAIDATVLTQTGSVVGSPGWMAPEQATGHQTTAAIDIFAWGATIAFAGTGRSPFGEGPPNAVLYRVVHEQPDLRGLDPRLAPVVGQALEKDPARRPNADQVLLSLLKTTVPGVVAAATQASVASATAVVEHSWQQPAQSPPNIYERPSHRTQNVWISVVAFVLALALIGLGIAYFERPSTFKAVATTTTTGARSSSTGSTTSTSTTTRSVGQYPQLTR